MSDKNYLDIKGLQRWVYKKTITGLIVCKENEELMNKAVGGEAIWQSYHYDSLSAVYLNTRIDRGYVFREGGIMVIEDGNATFRVEDPCGWELDESCSSIVEAGTE